jgi:hypothetical protein
MRPRAPPSTPPPLSPRSSLLRQSLATCAFGCRRRRCAVAEKTPRARPRWLDQDLPTLPTRECRRPAPVPPPPPATESDTAAADALTPAAGSAQLPARSPPRRTPRRSQSSMTLPSLPIHMRNPKKGRARVFRECAHCEHENHIRRSTCQRCGRPLPVGKRRKETKLSAGGSAESPSCSPSAMRAAAEPSPGTTVVPADTTYTLGQSLAISIDTAAAVAAAMAAGASSSAAGAHGAASSPPPPQAGATASSRIHPPAAARAQQNQSEPRGDQQSPAVDGLQELTYPAPDASVDMASIARAAFPTPPSSPGPVGQE